MPGGNNPVAIPPAPITDLVAFVNQLNEEGTALYRRLSPQVLIALMGFASVESAFIPVADHDTGFQINDNLSIIKGAHNIKLGFEFNRGTLGRRVFAQI